MYWQVVLAIATAVVGAFLAVKFWDTIRETVAKWLRVCGWEKSVLMDAWIQLDRLISGVRCKIFFKKRTQELKVFEETYTIDEIDDPDVLAELEKRGFVERNVMTYIQ